MKNSNTMTLKLKRIEVCDIRLALSSLIYEMKNEFLDANLTKSRKDRLNRSIAKLERLHAEIVMQFDKQDTEG